MSLPESTKTNPVDCIKDLLANAPEELGGYGNAYSYSYASSQPLWPVRGNYGEDYGDSYEGEIVKPEVYLFNEVSQQERNNTSEARLYVWQPIESDLEPFDAEVSSYDQTSQVEIHIWTPRRNPGEQVHVDMKESVVEFLSLYSNDNENRTPFHRIRPLNIADLRSEHQPRGASHFISTVTVELRRLKPVVVA